MVAKFIGLFLLCYQLYHPGMTIMFSSVDVTELYSSSSSLLFFFYFYNYYFFLSKFTHRKRYAAVKCHLNQYSGP